MFQQETITVIQLGVGMCLLYTAIFTQGSTVQAFLSAVHDEDPRISMYAGYYSLTINLIVYTVANLFAAPIVLLLSPKWTMVVSCAGTTIYMLGFLYLNPYVLYFSSVLQGISASVLATAVGVILAQNSSEKSISKHSGIMWMLLMISMIIGGIFLLVMFSNSNKQKISVESTKHLYIGFACFAAAGGVVFALMKTKPSAVTEKTDTWKETKKLVELMLTVDMAFLFPLFLFVGLQLGVYSTVYSTALAYTNAFQMNTNVLLGWNSIATGSGQIFAAVSLTIFGERTSRFGITPLVLISSVAGCIAYTLAWINIPGNASYETTDDVALINPSVPIALIAGFLMGVCDCFGNTAIFAFISARFEQEAAPANSVVKFVNALPYIAAVYGGSMFQLHWHLGIAFVAAIVAFFFSMIAERRANAFQSVGV